MTSSTSTLARHCERIGIDLPPGALGTDDAALVVSAIAGARDLDVDAKRRLCAAYLAARSAENVAWDDMEAWARATGWYDKASAVLEICGVL